MSCHPVDEPKFQGTCRRMQVIDPVPPRWLVKLVKWTGNLMLLAMGIAGIGFIFKCCENKWSVFFMCFALFILVAVWREIRGRARRAYVG